MAPSQIILFSQPRSACHLLERILTSKQTDIDKLYHPTQHVVPFINEWSVSENRKSRMYNATDYEAGVQQGTEVWQQALEEQKQKDRTLFAHTHPFYNIAPEYLVENVSTDPTSRIIARPKNITLFPDDVLLHGTTVPIFTIRHPVLFVPSLVRSIDMVYPGATRETYMTGTNLGFSRELYDWYKSCGAEAIVADADDFMISEKFARHLAATVGLDPERVAFTWPKTSEKEKSEMIPVLLSMQPRLVESKGPEPERAAKNIDLDAERENWKPEFGEEKATLMEELVQRAMPHYEYLKERRLRLP